MLDSYLLIELAYIQYLLRSNPFLAIDVLRKCSKLLRKTLYFFVDQLKERMSQKNTYNDLEKELAH